MTTTEILSAARGVKSKLACLSSAERNAALNAMARGILSRCEEILEANKKDIANAKSSVSPVMIDRLTLDEDRITAMADGIRDVAALPDPVGRVIEQIERPNGLLIEKVSVPLGVIAIIYESRPNVTSDAAALSLKSGNVCVLRSGKEAWASAAAIVSAMRSGLSGLGLPPEFINLIEDTSRESSMEIMKAVGYIDLLIPRGGAGLIRACVENALVPCIETGTGICHVYIDNAAEIPMALNIVDNAKTSRPSVCNAAEVCLVGAQIAPVFLPLLRKKLVDDKLLSGRHPVELRLDENSRRIIEGVPASGSDFDTEFLDYILAVKIVKDVREAAEHISVHSTGHSEAIVTSDPDAAGYFTGNVDSSAVYVNASTRFTDGGVFGLGCEMGISTQKLHARGPMGLKELTSYKYIIKGNGQIR